VEKQAEVFGVRAAETSTSEIETEPSPGSVPEVVIPPVAPMPAEVTQLVMFGMSNEAIKRRKPPRRPSSPITARDQLRLFPT
jgi:hypothetical protein